MEEKALRMNAFIFQMKERYLKPRIIVVSINLPIAAANGGVFSLSMDYPWVSCHELRCIRVPLLFLILRLFIINIYPIKLRVCICQV